MKTNETQNCETVVEGSSLPTGQSVAPVLSNKIEVRHLAHLAIVYVRQSSARQVRENIESTQLQYGLTRLARSYGWPEERIETIDDDLGMSGKSLEGRTGFQRLLAEISLGHVGIVMGIEMSRLARNCRDWHQLLELCGVFGTLLADADGIYNPREHNDRLLLGLKGTMSEAELHVIRGRLDAGKKNKARRGEYFGEAPIGYVRTQESVALEPDAQAQGVVRLLFDKFEELGSAHAVLRFFHDEEILIGRRINNGPKPDDLTWHRAKRSTIVHILRHPIYAGAYVFGRSKSVVARSVDGSCKTVQRGVGIDQWQVLIHDKLPAYIAWEQWERNQVKLKENSTKFGFGVSRGTSLLVGRVFCGKCGSRMPVHYREGIPSFDCSIARMQYGEVNCQTFNARWLEPLIADLVLQALEPASVQLSMEAAESIEQERSRLEMHHQQSIDRATYEVGIARRRYEEVDPSNRLVASELEKRWETALQAQRKCEETLNRFRNERHAKLTQEEMDRVMAFADDFRSLWKSERTSAKDRQDLVRILIEKIVVETVGGTERLSVTVHWAGGFKSQHESRRTVSTFDELEDSAALFQRAQQLYDMGCPHAEMISRLNREGFHPARKSRFTTTSINALFLVLRRKGMIKSKPALSKPFWRSGKLAEELSVNRATLTGWRHRGWVQARQIGSRWIYWATEEELSRLKKLASHPARGSKPTPQEFTVPVVLMPRDCGQNS